MPAAQRPSASSHLPAAPATCRNFPARGAANSDALLGHMPEWGPTIRAATPLEAQPYLLHPAFSRCTLPVAIWTAWPYNYFEWVNAIVAFRRA